MPKISFHLAFLLISIQLSFDYVRYSYGFAKFNMNQHRTLSQMRTPNFPQNKKFDAAKQAMNLITMIDLPTCRCVNTLTAGNLQCEVGIPSTHLRILNLDCRKVLGCSMDVPITNFGVCCRRRKVIKPYISPNDLKQLLATLGRFKNNGIQHQQCTYSRMQQNSPMLSQYLQPPTDESLKEVTKVGKVNPVEQKTKLLANLMIEKDAQTKANVRLASDIISHEAKTVEYNNLKSNETNLDEANVKSIDTVQEENRCRCLPNEECPTDKKDFTFGISCKMGMVRCCISVDTTDNKETVINVTAVSSDLENENSSDATATTTTPAATTTLIDNESLKEESTEINPRISNHRKPGENAKLSLPHQEPPYRRYATPVVESPYYHRIQMSRPNDFYRNWNNVRTVLSTQKPRYYHPNDGRFVNFPPSSHNLNLDINKEKQNSGYKIINPSAKQNFVIENRELQSKSQNNPSEIQKTKKIELKEEEKASKNTFAHLKKLSTERPNTFFIPSVEVQIAQNRNMKIEDNDSEDTFIPNNNVIRGQNQIHRNYPTNSRTANPSQQEFEIAPSFFGNFRSFLTGVGKAVNQVFGR